MNKINEGVILPSEEFPHNFTFCAPDGSEIIVSDNTTSIDDDDFIPYGRLMQIANNLFQLIVQTASYDKDEVVETIIVEGGITKEELEKFADLD